MQSNTIKDYINSKLLRSKYPLAQNREIPSTLLPSGNLNVKIS